jgi:hypothetical protein
MFAAGSRAPKIDCLGYPLVNIRQLVDFAEFASDVARVFTRVVSAKGGRSACLAEIMARILVLKQPLNLSDERVEFEALDRLRPFGAFVA